MTCGLFKLIKPNSSENIRKKENKIIILQHKSELQHELHLFRNAGHNPGELPEAVGKITEIR